MNTSIKPLSFTSKILLSIYPILALVFIFIDPMDISFELYQKIGLIGVLMMLIFLFFYIRRILKVNHPKKTNYIAFSLLLFPYTLYYIWTLDDLAFEN